MSAIYKSLVSEEEQLLKQVYYLKKQLETLPEGILEISCNNGYTQYYHRPNGHNGMRPKKTYIRKADRMKAEALAQRDYDLRLLKELEKRLQVVRNARKTYEQTEPEKVLLAFTKKRQELINPAILSTEQFVSRWMSEEYKGRAFQDDAPEIYTARGERVRSKSEKIIADSLERLGIPYKYEVPLVFPDGTVFFPDFRVLNIDQRKEYIWEHFGMMDDEQYVSNMVSKINRYIINGYLPGDKMILTMENGRIPLSTRIIETVIKKYL